jgi:hypothetical protein
MVSPYFSLFLYYTTHTFKYKKIHYMNYFSRIIKMDSLFLHRKKIKEYYQDDDKQLTNTL